MGLTNSKTRAILCLDIDGTLLDSNERVHPRDIQVLEHFPTDIQLILNTGRPLHSAKPILKKNTLFMEDILPVPGIFMNGGVAYFPGELLCMEHRLEQAISQRLLDISTAFPKTEFVFCTISETFQANQTPFGDQIVHLHHLNSLGNVHEINLEKIIKVMALNEDMQALKQIRSETKGLHAQMSFSLPYIFEFNPPGITKASTLVQLVSRLGLSGCPIFTAGDGENDLPVFQIAQSSFAPDTAHPKLKERADHVITRNINGLLEPILKHIDDLR